MDADVARHIGSIEGRMDAMEETFNVFRQESSDAREKIYRRLEDHAAASVKGQAELKDLIQTYVGKQDVDRASVRVGIWMLGSIGAAVLAIIGAWPELQKIFK